MLSPLRTYSQSDWHVLASDLQSGSEEGKSFLDFIVGWCDRAEEKILRVNLSPISALRSALTETEEFLGSRKNILIVGQALAVITMHWYYGGQDLTDGLTEVELRLVQDVLAVKIAQLEALAEQSPTGGE